MRERSQDGNPPNFYHGVILRPDCSIEWLDIVGKSAQRAVRASLGASRVDVEELTPGIEMWHTATKTTTADTERPRMNTWAMGIALMCKGVASVSAVVGNVVLLGRSPGGFSASLSPEAAEFIHQVIQDIGLLLEAF